MAIPVFERELPFGKLAENLGKNLGESMGQESQRQMTARGVESLAQQFQKSGKSPTQLELISGLGKVPGMTRENLQFYAPLITNAIRQTTAEGLGDQFQKDSSSISVGGEGGAVPVETRGREGAPRFKDEEVVSEEETTTLVKPADLRALQTKEKTLTSEERVSEAAELMRRRPGLFSTIDQAESAVDANLEAENKDIRQSKELARQQESLTRDVESKFVEKTSQLLQREGYQDLYPEIAGTIQNKLLNQALKDVENGVTPEKAATKQAQEALAFARNVRNFRKDVERGLLGRGEVSAETLGKHREQYEKYNALPEFVSELKKKGFGDHYASQIAYGVPTSVKKDLAKWEKGLSKSDKFAFQQGIVSESKKKQESAKLSESLTASIGPKDSLYSIALSINDQGLDETVFYDSVSESVRNGDIELSTRQTEELNQALPVVPSIGDLFASATSVFSGGGRYGFTEAFKKRFLGKR